MPYKLITVLMRNAKSNLLSRTNIRFGFLTFAVAASLSSLFLPQAQAVPSYSRQTGMACGACHYAPPELTPFGRKFKLEGYTFTTKAQVTDQKKDHNAALALLEAFPLSVVFDTSLSATKSPQPGTQNGNFEFPQDVSLFLAGAWTSHIGSFAQVTYDGQADHFSWDNTDIRYANHDQKLFDRPVTFGLTLNNNPSVEDLWNTTPAWGFPYVASDSAPTPTAGAIINGALAQDVAGAGGYAMWDDHWYLAGTVYRSEHIGSPQPNSGAGAAYNIRGVAPYWRAAYQTTNGYNYFEFGTYGMHVKSTPNAVTGIEDSYTDWAVDFEDDLTIPQLKNDVVTIRGTYIRENSNLLATFAGGGAAQTGHRLNTAEAHVEYHFGTRFSATAGLFDVTGTADPLLFPPAAVSGNFNGSPQSNGYLLNFSWWPAQNVDLAAQYTGSGRDASSNNTIYLLARFVF